MSKKTREAESNTRAPSIGRKVYKDTVRKLQIELVKLQRHFIECDEKILIILEGRDASGKSLVRASDKRLARLNIIKDLLGRLHYKGKDKRLIRPDRQIVFPYNVLNLENGQLAK